MDVTIRDNGPSCLNIEFRENQQGSLTYLFFWGGIKQCKYMVILRDFP